MHKSTVQTDSHPEDIGNADKACNGQVYSTHMDIVVTEASHYNILKIFHQGHICGELHLLHEADDNHRHRLIINIYLCSHSTTLAVPVLNISYRVGGVQSMIQSVHIVSVRAPIV